MSPMQTQPGSRALSLPSAAHVLLTVLALVVFLGLPAREAFPGQATLSWDPPTTNVDGTPLTDLAGYKVYYGTVSRSYFQSVNGGNATTYTVANLTDGATYYFAVTAYDTAGNESAYSNEVTKTIPSAAQYTLTVQKSGTGSGTVTATGINCGSDCSEPFNLGAVVTLSAAALSGSSFAGWSNGGCSGTGTCSITMNASATVTATFNPITYSILATAGAGGAISPPGSVSVAYGASRTLTITPNVGYRIADVKVDGASVGAVPVYTFSSVTVSHTIAASFAGADIDGDGVTDLEESGTLGNNPAYDGNADGTADRLQSSVASLHVLGTTDYVTLVSPEGRPLRNVVSQQVPQPSPAGMSFPYSFLEFGIGNVAPGGSTSLNILLPAGSVVNKYYKYGPTPDTLTPHWYEFMYDGQTGAEIAGNIVTLHFVDGIRGDDDLTVNGFILDQGGPAKTSDIAVNPLIQDSEAINVGSTSSARVFTVTNNGAIDVSIGTVALRGIGAGDFRIRANTCTGTTLVPSASCIVSVSLAPLGEGPRQAVLVVLSKDSENPFAYVALSVTGSMSPVFADVPEGAFGEDFINTAFYNGITGGCSGGNYCPDDVVTRAQMAVFIVTALKEQPAATCTGTFRDVNATTVGDAFCRFIEKFATLGITGGCGGGNYCPHDPVTRAQMAVFLTVALYQEPESVCTGKFSDSVGASVQDLFCRYIEKFATLGITGGCGGGKYCPQNPVTRAQMAVFLTAGFLQ